MSVHHTDSISQRQLFASASSIFSTPMTPARKIECSGTGGKVKKGEVGRIKDENGKARGERENDSRSQMKI